MSGQYPQQSPWPGQPHWQGAPPPRARRRGWIVATIVAVLALLAGGGVMAWQLAGDDSGSSSATPDDPAPDPTEPSPTPTPTPTEPTASPVNTDPWGSIGPGTEVDEVTSALDRAGYACYNTLDRAMLTADEPITVNGEDVLVRRCYLDPATSRDEDQTVSLQTAPDGSVNGIRVVISALLDSSGNRTSRWFGDVVRALTGPVLTSSESRQILAGRTPDLAWGTAELTTNRERTSYQLDLTAKGSDLAAVAGTNTGVSLAQVRAHYTSKGFSCRRPQAESIRCERTGRGHALIVSAVDVCRTGNEAGIASCAGNKTVSSLTYDALFNAGLPERVYGVIFDDFITDSIIFSFQDEWSSQIDSTLAGVGFMKRHRVDIGGLHVELLPHTTGEFDPQYEQAYQVRIEGVCATDC